MDVSRNLLASIVNLQAAEKQTNTHLMCTMETSLTNLDEDTVQFEHTHNDKALVFSAFPIRTNTRVKLKTSPSGFI